MHGSHVEEIKSRLPIDEVIGSYLTLEHKGKYLCARCPFHNEKSASFYVSPDRGTYYCFGCGEKGDIFSFVERYEGLDFRGALTELARRAGVTLKPVSKESIDKKESLYLALESAASFYEVNLSNDTGALEYIKKRGVKDETIKFFRIGYSPKDWSNLVNYLKQNGFSDEIILSAGLGIKGEKGVYDRFRGRIMFPITDSSGRVIGFSGRILPELDDGKSGKYVNSPDTELYHKSNILYGFSRAKPYIRKHDFSILVEGQFDVVLSHQEGFPNTVAVSGTAFSGDTVREDGIPTHLGLLSRLSKNMILALDADEAGEKAMLRVIGEALPLGISLKLIKSIPGSKDPADILSSPDGSEIWKEILKESLPPISALCKGIINKKIPRDKEINEVKKSVFPIIALMKSAIDRHEAARIVEKYFSLPVDYILKDVENIISKAPINQSISPPEKENSLALLSIKERFWGLVFASEIANGGAAEYRSNLKEWVKENIPPDVANKDEAEMITNREIISLEADVELERASKKEAFVEDIKLQYEESVFRVIVGEVLNELTKNEHDQGLITQYTNLRKKIEEIKQKRRNI